MISSRERPRRDSIRYAAPVNTRTSNLTGPAVGATPAVPGTSYIVPTVSGWTCTALLTTGNHVKGYRMVGIPDGLGAFDNGDRTIIVLICGIGSWAAIG